MASVTVTADLLPNSLNLPPHLSAHKYFFVCTLTVAAWDTLVLSPRSWKMFRSEGWPVLKIIYSFLRFFMPAEFVVVGVAFFDSNWSLPMCQKFYLFEPICTAILLACCSAVHVIRIYAIHDRSRSLLLAMSGLLTVQIVVTGICCAFFRSVPLLEGQGCIAGPKANWVGVYWLSATILYITSFFMAVARSLQSLDNKSISTWKLMLRDGLNLYGAIALVNTVNMLFWFIVKPSETEKGPKDTIKTVVTSMTAVLTTTMTLRIILSVRGSLESGGTFAGHFTSTQHSNTASGGVPSGRGGNTNSVLQINSQPLGPTYTLDGIQKKVQGEWIATSTGDHKVPLADTKETASYDGPLDGRESPRSAATREAPGLQGVRITVDREVIETPSH
ncbi:hypothetical protein OF83DRAFT_1163904 [Amylostereum chailletii]|nr:hypothetical protein OF83DRAFT_1163904 [Amylostereum chailletii]